MKLDVGCGHNFRGDVNVDLYVKPTKHRMLGLPNPDAPDMPLTQIPNLIRADCIFLPIRDSVFDKTVSCHLLEHIEEPYIMLKEMARVTKPNGTVYVETPHRLSHRRKWSLHKHSFNLRWFEQAFQHLNIQITSVKTSYRYVPHSYFPLIRLPYFIYLKGKVKK